MELQRRLLTPLLLKKVPPVPLDEERPYVPLFRNALKWLFFSWLFPVLFRGYKRTLQPEDLPKLNDKIKVEYLAEKFHNVFTRRLAQAHEKHILQKLKQRNESPESSSVSPDEDLEDFTAPKTIALLSLAETFKWQYMYALFMTSLGLAAANCNPLVSRKLIAYVEKRALGMAESTGTGVGYAIGVSVLTFAGDLFMNQGFYFAMLTGAECRGVFTKLLLDKSFKLNAKSRKIFPPSKITSIMSTDVSRIDQGLGFLPWLFMFPVPMAISIGILVYNIHAPAMVGVGIMFAFLFFAGALGSLLFKFRTVAQKSTDARVSYMKEILNNLKMIKFYSWESPYLAIVERVRKREMGYLLRIQSIRALIIAIASSLTLIASMAAFLTLYGIASPTSRNPASIFSSLSLFNMLASQFVILPLSLASAIDAMLGLIRLGNVLAAPEIDFQDRERQLTDQEKSSMESSNLAVAIRNGNFEWEQFDISEEEEEDDASKDDETRKRENKEKKEKKKQDKKRQTAIKKGLPDPFPDEKAPPKPTFQLHDVNFQVPKGDFIVITGLIGSGKSSLLCAIEGLMKRLTGHVLVNGSSLLCGTPWIQNTTVRNNILFDNEYDREWYRKVIFACCLEMDLDLLPAGDKTEIGERGITLSGGQKARVCLARTVYANKDIVLLDDVLSAVDAKVGQHIMQHCVHGLLLNKTRILATHQLSLIGSASEVIFLNSDRTISKGSVPHLLKTNSAFKELMDHDHTKESAQDDTEDDVPSSVKSVSSSEQTEVEDEKKLIVRQITQQTSLSGKEDTKSVGDYQERTADGRLISEEEKSVNAIGWDVYATYIRTGVMNFKFGWILPVVLSMTILAVFFDLFTNTWLSFWIEKKFNRPDGFYIGLYVAFTCIAVFMMSAQFIGIIYIMNNAAKYLNLQAVKRVLHVPMSYMDVTPMGRIINRFTKDSDTLDNEIGDKFAMVAYFFSNIAGVLILCIIYLPWFAIAIPVLVFLFVVMATFYQASGREVKRLEAVQRSHVYNNFNETLTGMETIKAFGKAWNFLRRNVNAINLQNEAYYVTVATSGG